MFLAKKFDVWENNFYGNDEAVFDDFCRQCLCYALNVVSYLRYNLFLEEKCNSKFSAVVVFLMKCWK